MGIGVLRTDKLNVVVVARHQLTSSEWAQWKRAIAKASDLLFDATQGQLRIGDVYFADNGNGEASADMVLYPSGDPSFSSGRFGNAGAAVHIMPYVKEKVLTFIHELGHNVWGLGEEYSRSLTNHQIDTTNPSPDKRTIPISPSGLAANQLVTDAASALLRIAGQIERHTVSANTSTSITVNADFSVLPTAADDPIVWIQRPAECSSTANTNFCIMEHSRGDAGLLAANGTWTPAAHPVTEYCSDSNHDPDHDTDQETKFADSCWETIVATAGYTGFTLPDPAAAGPAAASSPPDFFVLDPDPRFAVVLDRSGSMADGTKLPDAKHGAVYWVEFCAAAGDQLSVIWYDHGRSVLLPLTEVDSLTAAQRQQLVSNINALSPGGATDIRDALLESLTQLSTPPTRAATQVTVLLSDGIHNSPMFSSALEAVPTLRENGVRVYALGVGSPTEVDMPTLDGIASGTGGRSYAVGTNQPNAIETALVEINAEVRGGIIDSLPVVLPDSKASSIDKDLEPYVAKHRRPPLKKLAKTIGLTLRPGGAVAVRDRRRTAVVRIPVEKGAGRSSFTLLHPENAEVWLYLIDPAGNPVDIGDPGHVHVRSGAPHEFSLVSDPMPGVWTLLLVRPRPGTALSCWVVAGIEHKELRIYADAPASAEAGSTVALQAGAFYGLPLTDLAVKARLRDPNGGLVSFGMSDVDANGEATGAYEGSFLANDVGLYQGTITIRAGSRPSTAQPLTRLLHLEPGGTIDTASDVDAFQRRIPVHVLVRKPGAVIEDNDREHPHVKPGGDWKRPTTLRSAKLRSR